jgi:hypothetical protein
MLDWIVQEVLSNNSDSITSENFGAVVTRLRQLQVNSLRARDYDVADLTERCIRRSNAAGSRSAGQSLSSARPDDLSTKLAQISVICDLTGEM